MMEKFAGMRYAVRDHINVCNACNFRPGVRETGAANELLSSALAALDTQPDVSGRSFSLRDADDRAAMVGHLIPIRRSAHDIFAGSYALYSGLMVLAVAGVLVAPLAHWLLHRLHWDARNDK